MTRNAKVQIAGRLSYREAIEQVYQRNPSATLADVRRETGAPQATVRTVRSRLVAAGRLDRDQRDFLRAV
jgi:DNA-binding IclR family transcriptional regulator